MSLLSKTCEVADRGGINGLDPSVRSRLGPRRIRRSRHARHGPSGPGRGHVVGWATTGIRWPRWPAISGWAGPPMMAPVREHGARLLAQAQPGASAGAIGVDETAFMRATAVRSTVLATGVVDLHRGRLIDIVEGHSRKVLADWLADQSQRWAARISVGALDPFRGYGAALSGGLPHAVRVLDPFHVERLGSPASKTCADGATTRLWASRPPRRPTVWNTPRAAPRRGEPHHRRLGTAAGRDRGRQ